MEHRVEIEFVEALGLILQNDGLPRIAGRLLGVFVLHGGPFSFAELSEKLQISRGSVSTNTRLLETLGAIERVSKPGERQDFFHLAADPYVQLIERWIGRTRKARNTIDSTAQALPSKESEARDRLADLSNFYRVMGEAGESALTRLRKADTPMVRSL